MALYLISSPEPTMSTTITTVQLNKPRTQPQRMSPTALVRYKRPLLFITRPIERTSSADVTIELTGPQSQ
jgi:hypothetical protein